MRFAHEQPGFDAFLTEVARQQGLPRSQVEKDYWITHILPGEITRALAARSAS